MTNQSELEPREFLRKLSNQTLLPRIRLVGFVKPPEPPNEIPEHIPFGLFGGCAEWIHIPISMIESIEYLGSAPCQDRSYTRAAISLLEPRSEEGRVFAKLLETSGSVHEPR